MYIASYLYIYSVHVGKKGNNLCAKYMYIIHVRSPLFFLWAPVHVHIYLYDLTVYGHIHLSSIFIYYTLGWEWNPEDRPTFAEISKKINEMSDINESMFV